MENQFIQDANAPQNFDKKPENYLVWAILSTAFCCIPLGIVSIIKASSVNTKWDAGDYEGARKASVEAKKWAIISAISGAVIYVLYIVFIIISYIISSAS